MATREGDPRLPGRDKIWARLPLIAAAIALLAVVLMGYDFGYQPSHSEKYGTVTETEAADGVMPSLAPDGGSEPTRMPETVASDP